MYKLFFGVWRANDNGAHTREGRMGLALLYTSVHMHSSDCLAYRGWTRKVDCPAACELCLFCVVAVKPHAEVIAGISIALMAKVRPHHVDSFTQ